MIRVVVAAHSREFKMSLFIALNAMSDVSIVAVAASTAELLSYGKTLRPDVAILESGLPGRSLDEFVDELELLMGQGRVLIVDGATADEAGKHGTNVHDFSDLEQLIQVIP